MKAQVNAYRRFHGVDPDFVDERTVWVPGELVLMGRATDTGYIVTVKDSEKDYRQEYVHDHAEGVRIYRRARSGEGPTRVMRPYSQCWLLGGWLGATYVDEKGRRREVSGRGLKAISPNERTLFALGREGVRYVIVGGKFRITDWMYH